ncbi:MAG TPA: polysaccharide biosynthesis/export family protein [Candidatus Omnitrophota bacterium]|nr:polysaccharide biosynthesis/export family protein [Candidatus Omnitrophota bacterium]
MRESFLFFLCAAVIAGGCAGGVEKLYSEKVPGSAQEAPLEEVELDYRINPKDILEIEVYPDRDLSREVTVTRTGTISFPLLGEIQVQGLSVSAMERKMKVLLEKDYLVNPQVYVKVKRYHEVSVSILGEVNRPGTYELESQEGETTLLEAIAKAGGFSALANIKKIKIIRTEGGQRKVYQVNGEDVIKGKKRDVPLKANDIIVVQQSWF